MVNMLAVTHDGRPISSQARDMKEAFRRLAEWADDRWFTNGKPLVRFFLGTEQYGVAEYTESEVKAEAKRLTEVTK